MKQIQKVVHMLSFAFLVYVFLSNNRAYAQQPADSTTLWFVETVDGNEYFGVIKERTGMIVKIDTKTLGLLTIQVVEIKKIYEITSDRIKEGEYWSDNPQATRYFWSPNGYNLKKGEGYYQNVWVFFNHMAVGLSETVSLGIGMVPAFLLSGAPTPVWITPKFSIPTGGAQSKTKVGVGVLVGTVLGEETDPYGIIYGVTTFGSRDTNVNLGIGLGFAGGAWADKPTLTLSAMVRTGKRGYFITENYLINDGSDTLGIVSMGGRLVGKRMSFDLGLVVPVTEGNISFALPWLGISVPMDG